jgi:hypothetical protein
MFKIKEKEKEKEKYALKEKLGLNIYFFTTLKINFILHATLC